MKIRGAESHSSGLFNLFQCDSERSSFPLSFRAGFQALSPTWNFELVQLGVRRFLMVVVGSFSSFCLKMNFWLPVYVNVLEKKIAKFAKCALPELQILEVVFIG